MIEEKTSEEKDESLRRVVYGEERGALDGRRPLEDTGPKETTHQQTNKQIQPKQSWFEK